MTRPPVLKVPCWHCGADTFTVDTGGDRWQAFSTVAVPTATCAVQAVALSRSRGIVWANTANPTPVECYPIHRCPQGLEARYAAECRPIGDAVAGALADIAGGTT